MTNQFKIHVPVGLLYITMENDYVTRISMSPDTRFPVGVPESVAANNVMQQLNEYFNAKRRLFCFSFDFSSGTSFQRKVWAELCRIPYGTTRTYGEIARLIGRPKASRAVGLACNRNPLLLVVPCHRVVGKDGSLTGFACGVEMKRFLLDLEKTFLL